jgi:voltage-gated potassium channel
VQRHDQPDPAARVASFEERVRRRIARRGALPYLTGVTALLAMGAGALARILDPRDFNSYEEAFWWALQTVTTVGYGDVVPVSTWGRILGAFIMLLGITFLAFLTAIVTSLIVSNEETEVRDALQRIEERLAAMVGGLDRP